MVAQVSAIQVPAGGGWPVVVAAQGAGVHRGEVRHVTFLPSPAHCQF